MILSSGTLGTVWLVQSRKGQRPRRHFGEAPVPSAFALVFDALIFDGRKDRYQAWLWPL